LLPVVAQTENSAFPVKEAACDKMHHASWQIPSDITSHSSGVHTLWRAITAYAHAREQYKVCQERRHAYASPGLGLEGKMVAATMIAGTNNSVRGIVTKKLSGLPTSRVGGSMQHARDIILTV
jgi:hypothetical protein